MSFRENLLRKKEVDRLSQKIIGSIGDVSGGYKVDKNSMKQLMEMAGYQSLKRRGLMMYARDFSGDKNRILLLDNELKIYNTNVEDIVIRKDPTLREMVKLRNIWKILSDQDVVVSSRTDTVKTIRREILEETDLTFTPSDIDDIHRDGIEALEQDKPESLVDVLGLFSEILSLTPPDCSLTEFVVYGYKAETNGDLKYGPIYTYIFSANTLHRYNVVFSAAVSKNPATYKELVHGEAEPEMEGAEVLDDLRETTLALPVYEIAID